MFRFRGSSESISGPSLRRTVIPRERDDTITAHAEAAYTQNVFSESSQALSREHGVVFKRVLNHRDTASLIDPFAATSFLLLVTIMAIGWRARGGKGRIHLFLVLWFLVALAPASLSGSLGLGTAQLVGRKGFLLGKTGWFRRHPCWIGILPFQDLGRQRNHSLVTFGQSRVFRSLGSRKRRLFHRVGRRQDEGIEGDRRDFPIGRYDEAPGGSIGQPVEPVPGRS